MTPDELTDDKLNDLEWECLNTSSIWMPKQVLPLVQALKTARAAMPPPTNGVPTSEYDKEADTLLIIAPLGRKISVGTTEPGVVLDVIKARDVEGGDGPCLVLLEARTIGGT